MGRKGSRVDSYYSILKTILYVLPCYTVNVAVQVSLAK